MPDHDDVETVRAFYESWQAGDTESAFGDFAEDIEWDARGIALPGLNQVFKGHDGVRAFWRGWFEAWERLDFKTEEVVVREDGRVGVRVSQRNLSRGAGIWVDQPPYWFVWTLEDGKATRVEFEWADQGRSV